MVDYSKGKIYKLIGGGKFYIGSTCGLLTVRKSKHKSMCKTNPDRRVYNHMREVNWDEVDIILIEEFSCSSKIQLHKRERYWIEELKPQLNFSVPTRTYEEYYQDNKERILQTCKIYRENNKEKCKLKVKECYLAKRDEYLAKMKIRYNNNKEHYLAKQKDYYNRVGREKQKAQKSKVILCSCGINYTFGHRSRHFKSKRHVSHL